MLVYSSPAKLNLFLHLTGRTKNGYHTLDSLFAPIEYADVITLTHSHTQKIEWHGTFANGIGAENSVQKACILIEEEIGKTLNYNFLIEKNIPHGAGLGGGSSNAATALRMLNEFFELRLTSLQLKKISSQIGADCSFFFENSAAQMRGIGDEIFKKVEMPACFILLTLPPWRNSTHEFYQNTNLIEFKEPIECPDAFRNLENLCKFLSAQSNQFEIIAEALKPQTSEFLAALKSLENCKNARITGTGSAAFALFEKEELALAALKNLQKKFPIEWGIVTKFKNLI